ncbi:hypothetical protein MCHI_003883 [Candidatus Magnetoovum chiemensis]|nr:hypothetical protein MCHI_003883 [Candidatus Magnetoovum chiemensis]
MLFPSKYILYLPLPLFECIIFYLHKYTELTYILNYNNKLLAF